MRSQLVTVVVPDEPALFGGRIATSRAEGPALMDAHGRGGDRRVGVTCFADESVQPDRVVIAESMAARLGIQSGERVEVDSVTAKPVSALTLESLTEEGSETLWRAIREDEHILGQCFWTGDDPDSVLLDVGDTQFRVRSFDDARPSELRVVTVGTAIELFVQGAKIGLDMVVLADVSGSMGVDDLPPRPIEGRSLRAYANDSGNVKRIDALKEALTQMLDARLRITGRESRMALLCFNETVTQRFPRGAGMSVVDSHSDPTLIADFRAAIASLSEYGSTAMSEAILRAAELLDTHGKDDNERLIVLVSDGKPYSQKGKDAIGEVVQLRNDEINLVSHLFHTRGIRLQAIGISDETLYSAWERRYSTPQHESLRPDHGLIRQLAEKGGGDPNRTGGVEVLDDFFQGLGAGYRRFVGRSSATPRTRGLSERARRAVADAAQELHHDERVALLDRFERDAMALNSACAAICGPHIGEWMPFKSEAPFIVARHSLADLAVQDMTAFETFARKLHTLMVQQGPTRRRSKDAGNRPSELDDWYNPLFELGQRINIVRIFSAHDKNVERREEQADFDRFHDALEHFVRRRQIAPDDRAGWAQLAAAMLRETGDLVHQCASDATRRAQVAAPAAYVTQQREAATAPDAVPDFDQTRQGSWEGRVRD